MTSCHQKHVYLLVVSCSVGADHEGMNIASPHLRRATPLGQRLLPHRSRHSEARPLRTNGPSAIARRARGRLDLSGHDAMGRPSELALRPIPDAHWLER